VFLKKYDIKQLDNASLLEVFKSKGEMRCMEEVYRRYGHLVFGVCLKYLKNREDAKDALNAVFEKLFLELRKHTVADLPAWLHAVTRNHCYQLLRKKDTAIPSTKVLHAADHSEEELTLRYEWDIQIDLLHSALEKLNPSQQRCIRLFWLEEKSYKEISSITGMGLSEVKSHIQNGMRNLRLILKQTA
jgi:RNA polymerase sigma factor (sigma-70 family)